MPDVDFHKKYRVATERLFAHRQALRRVAVRIGFWPDGLVVSARLTPPHDDAAPRTLASSPPPRTIPWHQLEDISEQALIAEIDDLCGPLYVTLGVVRA